MADPKYANLPGIDVHSPDVFETSDLPEDEQNLPRPEELSSESVEQISVNTDAAFKAFKGKGVNVGKTDFSDSVSKERAIGYYAELSEYELAAEGSKETPQQKYQRIQHEMRELAEEVSKIKDSVKSSDTTASASPVPTGKQLEYLQHQLADLHLETLLGPQAKIDLNDPQGALAQRLLTQLESFKATKKIDKGSKDKDKGSAGSDQMTYQLYYRPEQSQFKKNTRLAKLEERLERLENVIGKNLDKSSILTADTENKSLISSMSSLNSKLSLLDASNTETVEARLNAVLHKMDAIAEKKEKEPQADPEKLQKINSLFDLTKKWEMTAEGLPQLVDRLVSLQDLHEQALQFSQTLASLDASQQEVKSNLSHQGDMHKQLQESLKENNKIIQENIKTIDKRLKALGN